MNCSIKNLVKTVYAVGVPSRDTVNDKAGSACAKAPAGRRFELANENLFSCVLCTFRFSWSAVALLLVLGGTLWGQPSPSGATVVINEVMASNGSTLADEDGDYEDWIELFNTGGTSVDLTGWGLSDNYALPFKWTFGTVTLEPGDFLIVWASGKNRPAITNGNQLHTSFSIAAAGEEVLLTRPDGTRMDEFEPRAISRDISAGRQPDGTGDWVFFADPTPGSPNNTPGFAHVLEPPTLSHTSGFYTEPFELTASHPHDDSIIRYTLDGSEPSDTSPVFPSSLWIASRDGETNYLSTIRTTLANPRSFEDEWYPPTQSVDKATVIRVRAFAEDTTTSSDTIATYFVGNEISDRHFLPVITLTFNPDDFFECEKGIYVAGGATHWTQANYWQRGAEWERPVHMEIFEDGQFRFGQYVGARIHGGMSRRYSFKSLRIYARGGYGFDHINYKLFRDLGDNKFRRFILRHSGTDWKESYFRDAFIHRLADNLKLDTQAYRPVVVYFNGEYWGIHNIRERYDRHYLHRVHSIDPDNLDMLTAFYGENDLMVIEGDHTHYDAMLNYVRANGVEGAEHYNFIRTQMDVENYADYLIINIYANNWDWPGNNITYWRTRTDEYQPDAPYGHDGRWRWLLFDTDFGFWLNFLPNDPRRLPSHNTLAFATMTGRTGWPNPDFSTFLPREMLGNEEFRDLFLNRMADQLNSTFLPGRVKSLIDEFAQGIALEMPAHIARHSQPPSMSVWSNHVTRMKDFAEQRPAYQFQHMLDYFSLPGLAEITLSVSNTMHGRIRINTLTIDETTFGIEDTETPYPWTGTYFSGIAVKLQALAQPGYRFAGWFLNGGPDMYSAEAELTLVPAEEVAVEARFESLPYWDVPDLLELIESDSPVIVDLDSLFQGSMPNSEDAGFGATTLQTNIVSLTLSNGELLVEPLARGEASLTLEANNTLDPPVYTNLKVLVYPAPHILHEGSYRFAEWCSKQADGIYPSNMLFLQSKQSDAAINTPLLCAYHVPHDDYNSDDFETLGFPYNNTRRTRINGLGEKGISFINTGRGRDLGGALLALDTRGVTNAHIGWLGGTVTPNARVYAIRLQYRVGLEDPFKDVPGWDKQPVEYVRHNHAGHTSRMPPVPLPDILLDQPYVQLLWRYYRLYGDSGPRAELRLDNILVTGNDYGEQVTANTGTPLWWLARHGFTNESFEVAALQDHSGNNLPAWIEFVADLAPRDPSAQLPELSLSHTSEQFLLGLDKTSTGRIYQLEYSTNLLTSLWTPLTNEPGREAEWIQNWTTPAEDSLYFRARILLPED